MMNSIQGLPLPSASLSKLTAEARGTSGPSFQEFMMTALDQVNAAQAEADHAVESFTTGQQVDPAEVLTAVQKADITFRMMMQIRNKLLQAYQEVKDLRI